MEGRCGALADVIADHEFKGKAGSSAVVALPRGSSARRLAVVGLGKADAKTGLAVGKKLGTALASIAKDQKAKTMGVVLPAETPLTTPMQQAAVEAVLLGLSPDTRYKSKPDDDENKPPPLESVTLLGSDGGISGETIDRARSFAAGGAYK